MTDTMTRQDAATQFKTIADRATAAGVFGSIDVQPARLRATAKASAAPAWYVLEVSGEAWSVRLETADRWLSESIETDLLHSGDSMEELIEEEMVELGYEGPTLEVKHYRSDDRLYTFRSEASFKGLSNEDAVDLAMHVLLGYEAAFRLLGDMEADEDE